MSVFENLKTIKASLPEKVKLIAVSKRQPDEKLQEAIDAGHRIFGENLVQELVRKSSVFQQDIEWHMIGHLQRNKVKYLAPFIAYIHSVDSEALLNEIQKRAAQHQRKIRCLFEVHIAQEDSKFGWNPKTLQDFLSQLQFNDYPNIIFSGLMGMATNTPNIPQIEQEFELLRQLFLSLRSSVFANASHFKELSIGMSGDYKTAIQHGSTMVRIGTAIFGERMQK